MGRIHPTAIVDVGAELDASVEVRPYAVIGPGVQIGPDCVIHSHAVLSGPMRMGARNQIFPFASVGALSQDLSAKVDDPTSTVIGDDNVIREYVSIQRGTMKEWETKQGQTRIGSRNLIMNYCHIAHDCMLGSDIIMANNASLAGHVELGDFVGLGGYTLVYQFCRIGDHAFTAFSTGIDGDIPPYMLAHGNPGKVRTINKTGLKRRGFSAEAIADAEDLFKLIYRSGLPMADVRAELAQRSVQQPDSIPLQTVSAFLDGGRRPLAR